MLKFFQARDNMVAKIFIGVILVSISVIMVITLVPGLTSSTGSSPDAVATVDGQDISMAEVQALLQREMRGQNVPKMLQSFYAKQVVDQLVFQHALELEADRLGIRVTPEEQADRIKQYLPSAFVGDAWIGKDKYALEVQQRFGAAVEEFETNIRASLLEEKFRNLVTDGISATPSEVQQAFQRKNQKIKVDYVLLKPADLAASINPSDADLAAFFANNSARYPVPEKRSARYALLDEAQLRQRATISETDTRNYYNQHLADYKVEDRAHVEHILFKTTGKTDAEIAEIQKKAEDVLNKARHGGNFEDLARKNSEDTSKDKGGDLGWIERGQTVPEFEKAAFTLPKGAVSDLVKTQYGFHIIKVLDRETAHTKPLDDVRLAILTSLADEKTRAMGEDIVTQLARTVRESNHQKIEDVAKKFGLQIGETPLVTKTEPVGELGNTPELHDMLFLLRPGELSQPLRLDRGYAIITVKDVAAAHAGTLAEVKDKVLADYRQEKSGELAKSRAQELAKRVKSGETLAQAAKALGLDVTSSDSFARDGSVAGVGPAKKFEGAFSKQVGATSDALAVDNNWMVFAVTAKEEPNPGDFEKQRQDVERQLVDSKRAMAYQAFREALQDRLKQEGKIVIKADMMKRLTSPA
jgi:peptidyl-prolyl cis-trans isomerase D